MKKFVIGVIAIVVLVAVVSCGVLSTPKPTPFGGLHKDVPPVCCEVSSPDEMTSISIYSANAEWYVIDTQASGAADSSTIVFIEDDLRVQATFAIRVTDDLLGIDPDTGKPVHYLSIPVPTAAGTYTFSAKACICTLGSDYLPLNAACPPQQGLICGDDKTAAQVLQVTVDEAYYFSANCPFGNCGFLEVGQTIQFSQSGDADYFKYYWQGIGGVEQVSPTVVSSYTYTTAGIWTPELHFCVGEACDTAQAQEITVNDTGETNPPPPTEIPPVEPPVTEPPAETPITSTTDSIGWFSKSLGQNPAGFKLVYKAKMKQLTEQYSMPFELWFTKHDGHQLPVASPGLKLKGDGIRVAVGFTKDPGSFRMIDILDTLSIVVEVSASQIRVNMNGAVLTFDHTLELSQGEVGVRFENGWAEMRATLEEIE